MNFSTLGVFFLVFFFKKKSNLIYTGYVGHSWVKQVDSRLTHLLYGLIWVDPN
jgi:hypothetical protein